MLMSVFINLFGKVGLDEADKISVLVLKSNVVFIFPTGTAAIMMGIVDKILHFAKLHVTLRSDRGTAEDQQKNRKQASALESG